MQKESGSQANDPSLVVTQQIIIGRMGDISCPVSCGLVLLGEVNIADVPVSDAAARLYSETESDYVNKLSCMTSLEMILTACSRSEIKPPRVVGGKYSGEWVEFGNPGLAPGSLQPAVWFRFFRSDETTNGLQGRWDFLTSESIVSCSVSMWQMCAKTIRIPTC